MLTLLAQFGWMSNYIRPRQPGASIFFTVNLADRRSNLLVSHINLLRSAVIQTRRERHFSVDGWVILPDHMHCVWTLPEGDADYSIRWSVIKARFSHALPGPWRRDSHIQRREKGVWQRRFWEHHLRGEADFVTHIRYCWENPVKHGLVTDPADWPYSSFNRPR